MSDDLERLSDRVKAFEDNEDRRLLPLPVILQFDGVSFGHYTDKLKKPFDERLHLCMLAACQQVMDRLNAALGYVQSDEANIVILPGNRWADMPYTGRLAKVVSIGTSIFTWSFHAAVAKNMPEYSGKAAFFDGHAHNVPNLHEAYKFILSREQDATNNSLLALAQAHHSPAELSGKSAKDLLAMTAAKGKNWEALPVCQKRGTFVRKVERYRSFTPEEIDKLPPRHAARANPNLKVSRFSFEPVSIGRLSEAENPVAALFEGEPCPIEPWHLTLFCDIA